LRLPVSAVHRIDNLPFVFVRSEPDLFAARRVKLGDRLPSEEIVVHAGVGSEDHIVSEGSFAIKSALLASRLGAGCTDD
jgi:cobalt-zinc-cadmium efflux system membrane fusion protein